MSKQNSCCARKPREKKQPTCCGAGQVNIALACSGGSNSGQITNEIAKNHEFTLSPEDLGKALTAARDKLAARVEEVTEG